MLFKGQSSPLMEILLLRWLPINLHALRTKAQVICMRSKENVSIFYDIKRNTECKILLNLTNSQKIIFYFNQWELVFWEICKTRFSTTVKDKFAKSASFRCFEIHTCILLNVISCKHFGGSNHNTTRTNLFGNLYFKTKTQNSKVVP